MGIQLPSGLSSCLNSIVTGIRIIVIHSSRTSKGTAPSISIFDSVGHVNPLLHMCHSAAVHPSIDISLPTDASNGVECLMRMNRYVVMVWRRDRRSGRSSLIGGTVTLVRLIGRIVSLHM